MKAKHEPTGLTPLRIHARYVKGVSKVGASRLPEDFVLAAKVKRLELEKMMTGLGLAQSNSAFEALGASEHEYACYVRYGLGR